MSQIKTIFKNLSWLMISQIITSACAFIWTILTARYLGVSEYGILGFAISLTGLFAITMDFGISTHIVRHISTDYDSAPKYLGNAIPLKSFFAVFSFVLILIFLIILGANELTITVTLLFTIEMIIKSMYGLFNGSFQAVEKGKYQAIGNIILNVILLIFILIAIFTDLGIIGISLAYLFANVIVLVYEYIALRNHVAIPKFDMDLNFFKKVTKYSIPFALTGFFYTIYYSIDMVMLTFISGDYANGIYKATYNLINVLTLFYSIYTAVIFPVMSKFFKNGKELLIVSFEKSIKYLIMITLPIAIGSVFYAGDIVHLIYGPEYANSASVLSILIWTVCFLFVNGACSTLLNASHREVAVTKIYFLAAIFNIILNFGLIYYYSYNGAAIATVLSDILILFLAFYVIYKENKLPNPRLYLDIVKMIIGSLVLAIALYILNISMWLAIPIGIIVYFGSILFLRILDSDDKYIIQEIIGKN